MILKASTRGSPNALARHLLNEQDNEHIEQHEVRGFMAEDVAGALAEIHAMSAGVKSRKPMFSVSLSPPEHEQVDLSIFERAVEEIEQQNGLTGQPRITIFHEKEGRRHMHAVWSRIDHERQAVIPLPFYKNKLQEVAKGIYLEQGWQLPHGFIDRTERDPRNFDLALYQQAKREGRDPRQIKAQAQEAWSTSDGPAAFQQALEARGLYLAKGDRRGHVALSWRGEVMSLPRLLGRKSKEIRERLGDMGDLRSVEDTRDHIARTVGPALHRLIGEAETARQQDLQPLDERKLQMHTAHAIERERMDAGQRTRQDAENTERNQRLRRGLGGLLDRVSGRYARLKAQNEREAYAALVRDREQRQAMVEAQLAERRALQSQIRIVRERYEDRIAEIHRDLAEQRGFIRGPSARLDWLQARQRDRQEQQEHISESSRPSERLRERFAAKAKEGSVDRLTWLQDRQRCAPSQDRGTGPEPDIGHDME